MQENLHIVKCQSLLKNITSVNIKIWLNNGQVIYLQF